MMTKNKGIKMETLDLLTSTKLETLSAKYQTVKSKDVLEQLEQRGFILDKVVKMQAKNSKNQGKQKHRLMLSHPELLATNHNDGKIQLLVTNSYNGTSSLIFQVGFFRYVCSNGLIFGDTFGEIKIRHTGIDIKERIEQAIVEIVAQAKLVNDKIQAMKNRKLSLGEINELQKNAVSLRLDEDKRKQLVTVNIVNDRPEDKAIDLFTVYNTVQEAVIRGNANLTLVDADGKVSNKKLRKVSAIDRTTNLNTKVFMLAENYLQTVA